MLSHRTGSKSNLVAAYNAQHDVVANLHQAVNNKAAGGVYAQQATSAAARTTRGTVGPPLGGAGTTPMSSSSSASGGYAQAHHHQQQHYHRENQILDFGTCSAAASVSSRAEQRPKIKKVPQLGAESRMRLLGRREKNKNSPKMSTQMTNHTTSALTTAGAGLLGGPSTSFHGGSSSSSGAGAAGPPYHGTMKMKHSESSQQLARTHSVRSNCTKIAKTFSASPSSSVTTSRRGGGGGGPASSVGGN
ncbi:unnamed protein product, partial [Amoebophrya sp. A120]|eukprot:GSA120T00001634001.1